MKIHTYALFLFLLMLAGCQQNSKPQLHVFIWGDYIKPELIEQFEELHGCQVILDTYDSNESMYAKLKLGGSGYDILFPSNYYLDMMIKQGMLEKIDPTKIANFNGLDPTYTSLIKASSRDYGIPFMVCNTGIAFRQDKVKSFEASWGVFGRSDLKGRMTLLNDQREVIGAALKYLGYSINTLEEREITAAVKQLITWKKNLAKFESEQYKNGIASGEYLISQGYSGDVLQVIHENSRVNFAYPKEGAMISIDFATIPKDALNKELAYTFINYLLDPNVAGENILFTHYLSPNKLAYETLPDEWRQNPILFPSADVLKKAELIEDLGDAVLLYNKAWDRVKAEE